jgi:hypothetical protein
LISTFRIQQSAIRIWNASEQLKGEGIVMRLIQISRPETECLAGVNEKECLENRT